MRIRLGYVAIALNLGKVTSSPAFKTSITTSGNASKIADTCF